MNDNWKEFFKIILKGTGKGIGLLALAIGGFLALAIGVVGVAGIIGAAVFGATSMELTLLGIAFGISLVAGMVMILKARTITKSIQQRKSG